MSKQTKKQIDAEIKDILKNGNLFEDETDLFSGMVKSYSSRITQKDLNNLYSKNVNKLKKWSKK